MRPNPLINFSVYNGHLSGILPVQLKIINLYKSYNSIETFGTVMRSLKFIRK